MDLTTLTNKVAGMAQQINDIGTNGKRFDEFPMMENINPASKVLVSTDGISETVFLQQIFEAITDESQNNKVRDVMMGTVSDENSFENILDSTGLTVLADEIVILSVLEPIENSSEIQQYKQRVFLWKLGKGTFAPIGSENISAKMFEMPSIYPTEETADDLANSPDAIVREYGVITTDILTAINTKNPPVSYDEDNENYTYTYYIRCTVDGVKFLYQFRGENAIYGDGAGQMEATDLVLIYSSGANGETVDSTVFIRKDSLGVTLVNTSANNAVLQNMGRFSFVIQQIGNNTILGLSKSFLGTQDGNQLVEGTEVKIINNSGQDQTLKYSFADVSLFPITGTPGNIDFVAKDNTITVLRKTGDMLMFESYSGSQSQFDDFLQQPFLDFAFNTPQTTYPMSTAAIGSGTLTLQSDSVSPASLRTGRPVEIIEAWGIKGNASAVNGGYSVGVASQNPLYVGSGFFMAVHPSRITDTLGRFGELNTNGISPLASPSTGVYLEIDGATITFKTTDASITSAATSATLSDTSWIFILFEVESFSMIRCKVRKSGINGTLIYNQTLNSNLPIAVSGSTWTGLRISMNGISKTASADTVFQLGRVITFAKKPNYLKSF